MCTYSDNNIVVCVSLPLKNSEGSTIGVVAVDVDIQRINNIWKGLATLKNSTVTLLDKDFCYINHPDTSRIFSNALQYDDSGALNEIYDELSNGVKKE